MTRKKHKRMRGTVHKVIKGHQGAPEKAQIHIDEADELYREVRVENELSDGDGQKAGLKLGAEVDIVIEADSDATVKKPD